MDAQANAKFEPTGHFCGNELLTCDGFFVSYNANPGAGMSFFKSDGGSDETALIVGDDFFILNGDFRGEYLTLHHSLSDCLKFFVDHSDDASSWSSPVKNALALLTESRH